MSNCTVTMTQAEFANWMLAAEKRHEHDDRWALSLFTSCASSITLEDTDGYEVLHLEARLTDDNGALLEDIEWNEKDSFLWFEPPYEWLVCILKRLGLTNEAMVFTIPADSGTVKGEAIAERS